MRWRRTASVSALLGALGGKRLRRNAEDQIRVGRETAPDFALAGRRHAGKVAVEIEQVGDELEVQMRRPPAVDLRRANCPQPFASGNGLADAQTRQRLGTQVTVQSVEGRDHCQG